MTSEKNKWVAHTSIAEENKINLLCFAYPGGSASIFAAWKKKLPKGINLIPVLYPEREVRRNEPMESTFSEFVSEFVTEAEPFFRMPYAFFGYCAGAVIAYEASLLAEKMYGNSPVYGMIVSSEAPAFLLNSLPEVREEDTTDTILEYLRKIKLFDAEVLNNKMFTDYYLPVFAADCRMLRTYSYESDRKLNCDLDVILGAKDNTVDFGKTEKWKDVCSGKVRLHEVEDGHFLAENQLPMIIKMFENRLLGE